MKSLRIDLHLYPVNTCRVDKPQWRCHKHNELPDGCNCDFSALILDQIRFEESGQGLDLLASALRHFPNLKEIQISKPKRYPFGMDFRPHHTRQHYALERLEDCGRLQLQYLIRAAAAAGKELQLENFHILDQGPHEHKWGYLRMHPDSINLSSDDISLARVAFRNVRHFTLQMPKGSFRDQGGIAGFLNSMSSLERFDFSQPDQQSPWWPHSFLCAVLNDVHWKMLHSIRFPNFRFDINDFIQFATRHADTLKSLRFDSLYVWDCPLRTFLTSLRRILDLDEFILQGDVMASNGQFYHRNYMIGQNEHGEWGDIDENDESFNVEEWHLDLIKDIGAFVTKKSDAYPKVKLLALRVCDPQWDDSESVDESGAED